jgi:hypothetical protein
VPDFDAEPSQKDNFHYLRSVNLAPALKLGIASANFEQASVGYREIRNGPGDRN